MIRAQVCAFHAAFGVPIVLTPAVPERERVTLRLRLIAEEFSELLDACGAPPLAMAELKHWLGCAIAKCGFFREVDIVSVADALADLDYVVEGTRLEFGIDGSPIADEVHRSNMAKLGGGMREDGKLLKPDGWTAPDIRGELIKQGWAP